MKLIFFFIFNFQIFLVTDLLFAHIKREFCLIEGLEFKIDGKEAKMALE